MSGQGKWTLAEHDNDGKASIVIYSEDDDYGLEFFVGPNEKLESELATRLMHCANACTAHGTRDSEYHAPWEWLAASVTSNGEGYSLLSPAGGIMRISNEQRERIVACVNFLAGVPTEEIGAFNSGCRDETKMRALTSMLRERIGQLGYVSSDPFDE